MPKKKPSRSLPNPFNILSLPQIILLAIIIGTYIYLKNPQILLSFGIDPSKLTSDNPTTATVSASLTNTAEALYTKTTDYFLTFAKNIKLPTKFTGLPEEVVIDEVVDNFSQEIKNLPQTQVKRIKTQICQDVINEAVATTGAITR